ncbi:MAG: hypothetical protein LAN62_00525 [Acidobacteriia bacterium]|nr:hypothetical protein [Terriglobia bacterium]
MKQLHANASLFQKPTVSFKSPHDDMGKELLRPPTGLKGVTIQDVFQLAQD